MDLSKFHRTRQATGNIDEDDISDIMGLVVTDGQVVEGAEDPPTSDDQKKFMSAVNRMSRKKQHRGGLLPSPEELKEAALSASYGFDPTELDKPRDQTDVLSAKMAMGAYDACYAIYEDDSVVPQVHEKSGFENLIESSKTASTPLEEEVEMDEGCDMMEGRLGY